MQRLQYKPRSARHTPRTATRRACWARLLKRVFDIDMRHCPKCGAGELKIVAAILDRAVIEKILTHPGLQVQPPPRAPAREPVPLHAA